MTRHKRAAIAVATGALALGVGVGAATIASADPTTSPSASPSASTSSAPAGPAAGPLGGHRRHDGPGRQEDLAKTLATKLGVSQAKVTEALQAFRDANRPAKQATGTRADPANRPDPTARDAALARSLASRLGVSEAKVTTALAELRSAAEADRAAALKTKLDAAVRAGTLTQAEADAVNKAARLGVISVGPR